MDKMPATIDLNPRDAKAQASVIWLHGLGADGNDFVPIVKQLGLSDQHKIRFVFPHAPVRPVTINGGMKMRAWYDIFALDIGREEDKIGIQESNRMIELLIERERNLGIPSQAIILAGFSQGGAMALYTGLRYQEPLGGIISLSAYLLAAESLQTEGHARNQTIPIFMAHGLFDQTVPFMLGDMSRQQLSGLGYQVEWHTYSMPHTVLPEEIRDIGYFIKTIF